MLTQRATRCQIAGHITLGGVKPDINLLVINTAAQVVVQSLIDLVRSLPLSSVLSNFCLLTVYRS